jgi:ribosome maturation factor RimP
VPFDGDEGVEPMRARGNGGGRPGRSGQPAVPPARGGLQTLRRRLAEVVEPVVRQAGFDLEQVRVTRVGRRHSVQVVVDHDDGVGLDAVAEVSRAVSTALDTAEESGDAVVPGEYVLEVSSPGVDRPLTEPRHWRRNLGRLVTVAGPAGRNLTGRISEVTAEAVVLAIDGSTQQLRYEQLGPGRVQVELGPVDDNGEDEGR